MILVTGSLAYDYIMKYEGALHQLFLAESLERMSVPIVVDQLRKHRGGTAGNIVYNLKMLEISPLLMATAGYDFSEYQEALNVEGISTEQVTILEDQATAAGFITSDPQGSQITIFHPGAMAKAAQKSLSALQQKIQLAMIAPESKQTMIHYVKECKTYGIPYIFDPGQNIPAFSKEELLFCIEGAKAFISNEYEWGLLQEKITQKPQDMLSLTSMIITTLGEKGSRIYTADQEITIPVYVAHEVQDPTGCGDAYRAGLIFGLQHNLSLEETGRIATLAALYCLEEHGTQNHVYSLVEFQKRLAAL